VSNPIRIAVFLRSHDNDYQALLRESCRVAARRHRFPLREVSASNDAEWQMQQLTECLAEPEAIRPRALIVFPVQEALLCPVAKAAAELGMAFVMLNRPWDYLGELRRAHPKVPLFCVMPDQRDIGRIQGQQFRWLLHKGGVLVYVTGTVGTASAELRLEGMRRELSHLEVEIVVENGDWSQASGTRTIEHWLRTRGASSGASVVVGAQNDSMAMGARSALVAASATLRRPELAEILVTGCDGTPTYGQALVGSNELAATVVVPPTTDRAVEELAQAFSTGRMPSADILLSVASFPDLAELGAASRALTRASRARSAHGPR
jgi:ABC-type sugar transport system substrate-binding protein